MTNRTRNLCLTVSLIAGYGGMGWAQQSQVGGLVPFSSLGKPTAITKPTLMAHGGHLLLSDSPEQFKSAGSLPAAMYRDQVTGDFRVFYHHQNVSQESLSVGVAITNTSSQPEVIFARGAGEGTSIYPDVAGQAAASSFISSSRKIGFAALLLPGKSYYKVQSLSNGDTASGILEYLVVTVPGDVRSLSLPIELFQNLADASASERGDQPDLPGGFSLGSATVSTVAFIGDEPADPVSLPILPRDTHTRGTFPHADRTGTFAISTAAGLQSLSVDTAPPGSKYSDPMPNEYEQGVDVVDGGIPVYDGGNYGVIYNFHIVFQRTGPIPSVALLMQPSGGAGHYLMFTNRQAALSPYVSYTSAWWFNDIKLRGTQTRIDLQTTLPGGASGPQKLLFDPGFTGQ
jgi:hypothetical protein